MLGTGQSVDHPQRFAGVRARWECPSSGEVGFLGLPQRVLKSSPGTSIRSRPRSARLEESSLLMMHLRLKTSPDFCRYLARTGRSQQAVRLRRNPAASSASIPSATLSGNTQKSARNLADLKWLWVPAGLAAVVALLPSPPGMLLDYPEAEAEGPRQHLTCKLAGIILNISTGLSHVLYVLGAVCSQERCSSLMCYCAGLHQHGPFLACLTALKVVQKTGLLMPGASCLLQASMPMSSYCEPPLLTKERASSKSTTHPCCRVTSYLASG